ncbi:MAG: hypothetical protein LBQ93_09790 [Treponema sp.]|nr:hypothetical protein [Treponema sp.]
MKNKYSHVLSIILIIIMAFLTIATSPKTPSFGNSLTIEYDDLYLYIKIKTNSDPNVYIIENNKIDIHFENKNEYQGLQNFVTDEGDNLSRSVIVNYPNEPEILSEGEFVFETFVEDDKFVIKIKKEIIKYGNIRIEYVYLENQTINYGSRERIEVYR